MRQILPITIMMLLLILSMTQFATAQQAEKNIITNQTTETLYVVSSTKYGAEDDIPDGYRTSGWKTIKAGKEKTFWAYDPHKIYFQIFKGSKPIKPQQTTGTFAFWIHRDAHFNIVTRAVINADITRDQLLYSSHDTNDLIHSDGFIVYNNGSRITVTEAWVPVPPKAVPNTAVNIPDTALRRVIEQKLKHPANTPITQADMETLTDLWNGYDPDPDSPPRPGSVSDLTGLEFATNLETLDLSWNNISDISPLANLVNLTWLSLSDNNISDLSPLANLVNLEGLGLSGNNISDIAPLANLVKLESLDLGEDLFGGNAISDISPLANLVNLRWLYLLDNDISDISVLSGLTNLQHLDISGNRISDFSPIEDLIPNLKTYWNGNQEATGPTTPPDPPDDTSDDGFDEPIDDGDGMDDGDGTDQPTVEQEGEQPPEVFEGIEQDYILHGFIGQENQIEGVAFSPDGQTLASIDADGILLHLNPHTLKTKPQSTENPDGELWDGGLREMHRLRRMRTSRSVAYSPKTPWIAAGTSDKTILLWNKLDFDIVNQPFEGDQTPRFTLPAPGQVWAVAFSPDGQTLASGGGYEGVHLWDMRLEPPQVKATLTAFTAQVESIAFHPDEQTLAVATGMVDEVVHLWDLQTQTLKDRLMVPQVSIRNIAFSPDGQMLAGGAYSTGGPYGQGEGVLLWKQAPLPTDIRANLIPHSVEISGPTIIGPAGHTYTFHVKNARGVGIQNALVSAKVPNVQTNMGNLITDAQGNASVHLQFPGIGKHDINVTVSERVTQQELKKTFRDRVEVPRPHAIAAAGPQPKPRERGTFYRDAFTVTSADGRLLEGFYVNIRIAATSLSSITDNKGIAPVSTRMPYPGEYDVNVAVLTGGRNSQEILKKTFSRRAIIYLHTCGTLMTDVSEKLSPERVEPELGEFIIKSNEGGFGYATPKAAVEAPEYAPNDNLAWRIDDTVADDSEELKQGSVIITVELLKGPNGEAFSLRQNVVDATEAWEKAGALKFRIIDEDDGKPSDIRVQVTKDGYGGSYGGVQYSCRSSANPWCKSRVGVGAPQVDSIATLEHHWNANNPTMKLGADSSYGTALHEFGHALGLAHEHLSPKFHEYFKWKFPKKELYSKIREEYGKSESELSNKDIDHNFLKVRNIDETLSSFDIDSVMTYWLSDKLIELRDDAPSHVKAVFKKNNGIPDNSSGLSADDKEFIRRCYGDPQARAIISGSIEIEGQDCDFGIGTCFAKETIDTSHTIKPYTVFTTDVYNAKLIKEFIWGGDCRVEVHIGTRKITQDEVEVAVYVPFYQEDGKAETTGDLDSIQCGTEILQYGRGLKIDVRVVNQNVLVNLARKAVCDVPGLKLYQKTLQGDIQAGGFDWAEVTIKLEAQYLAPGASVPSAPSPLINRHPTVLKLTSHAPFSDINGDGQIDLKDLLLISKHIGQTAPVHLNVDVNADGIVTIADLVQVAQFLGQSQDGASAPTQFVAPPEGTYAMVKEWIRQARLADDGSIVFRQGIAKLEYLLTLMIPEETALLVNYPNPFNPETWIPYHLAEHADVTLTIYSVDGKVVRRLDLGHQEAGYYQSKARAAYWDGRNNVGERVASGIYFYTLEAGDFAATRKMLILK